MNESENGRTAAGRFQRPATAPDFLLSREHQSVRTQGVTATFNELDDAMGALAAGEVEMLVGALPFDVDAPVALTAPKHIIVSSGPLEPPAVYRGATAASGLHATVEGRTPTLDEHRERVAAAIATIDATAGEKAALAKVVLARSIDLSFDTPVDPLLVAARFIDMSANRDGFYADLAPAGAPHANNVLVGSSPEQLVRRFGRQVTSFPLAGSLPRSADPKEDARRREELAHSRKDLTEHQFVVEWIESRLRGYCAELSIPRSPQLVATREMWHLGTPVSGVLADPATTALDLALAVHPTPAICGTPTDTAFGLIQSVEEDRGFYSGAVGWTNKEGDGEWMVSIRCAEMSKTGKWARAWAGGGIVAQSDPDTEVAETAAKLRTALKAFGLS